ncbi:MAG: hypothetical protein KBD78_16055 [Oligoflexales bacterium]|nr:hypothetical protein [Oligoflexales bacterium]
MKQGLFVILFSCLLMLPTRRANADLFGGDVAVLVQILSNNIQQLYQLMEILQKGKDSLNLMREVNSGLNDVLQISERLKKVPDIHMYHDWQTVAQGMRQLAKIYGSIPTTRLASSQRNSDQVVAEAVALGNHLQAVADSSENIGSRIKSQSAVASPKGAAKLSAQSLGVLVENSGESLRAQALGLKLLAQEQAVANQLAKEETKQFISATQDLSKSLKSHRPNFNSPSF